MFMFTHHCTACERRQLVFPSMLTGVAETDHGLELSFTCWCGAPQAALQRQDAGEPARPVERLAA